MSHAPILLAALAGLLAVLAGCPRAPEGDGVLTLNPTGRAPLAALLEIDTDEPTRIDAVLLAPDGERKPLPPVEVYDDDHDLMVLGLTADATFSVEVTATTEAGGTTTWTTNSVRTAPLPESVPRVEVTVRDPERMEPGYTQVAVLSTRPLTDGGFFAQVEENRGVLVVVDDQGRVVWYLETPRITVAATRRPDGNILYWTATDELLFEFRVVDMLGRTLSRWVGPTEEDTAGAEVLTDAGYLHHGAWVLGNGNTLVLGEEVTERDAFPGAPQDDALDIATDDWAVVSDVLAEYTPEGELVWRRGLSEFYDVARGYGEVATPANHPMYWSQPRPTVQVGPTNWIWAPPDGSYVLFSMQSHDAVVKYDREEDAISWILGSDVGWSDPSFQDLLLQPAAQQTDALPGGQHGISITPAGTLLLYDNEFYGVGHPGDGAAPRSTVREYAIDEAVGYGEEVWSYRDPDQPDLWTPYLGDARSLPTTGNVLVTHGYLVYDPETGEPVALGPDTPELPDGTSVRSRITEVTHTDPPEKVFEFELLPPEAGTPGRSTQRAARWSSLYPPTGAVIE